MNYLDKCVELYGVYLSEHLINSIDIEENVRRIERAGAGHQYDSIVGDKEVQQFTASLMSASAREVLQRRQPEVMHVILHDVREILDGAFSEDELKGLYEFATSSVGKKILRNLELFSESFMKGNIPLMFELTSQWTSPETWEKVRTFIESRDVQD